MNFKKNLKNIAYVQIAIYSIVLAAVYWRRESFDFGLALMVFLIIGAAALIARKSWGRKIVLIGSAVGLAYVGWQLCYAATVTDFAFKLIFILTCTLSLFYYNIPDIKNCFTGGESLPPWTILVVDDDKTLLKLLKTRFERHNISVLTAGTGELGLALAEQARPDLIILDVILPKMKGRAVCAKIKENPRTKDIPVIFLTAKNSLDDVHAEMEVGAHAHITKPVNFQRLLSQVKNILSV